LTSFLRPASLILFPTTFLEYAPSYLLFPLFYFLLPISVPYLIPLAFLTCFSHLYASYLLLPLFRLQQSLRPLLILCGTLLPN
jgi:hypothetical protein